MKKNFLVNVISLGCPKNLVDSEIILGHLGQCGYTVTPSANHADVIIINTCSFIRAARHESYETITRISDQLSLNQKLIVCGCLPQLEQQALFARFPKINALIGSADYFRIAEVVGLVLGGRDNLLYVGRPEFIADASWPRLVSTAPGYAYIKLSEGCSNCCSYCLIPQLRGSYRSRSVDDILAEAGDLAAMGIKELILIAQDTSFYGWDQHDPSRLLELVRKLEQVAGIEWIRMLYAHPGHIRPDLLLHMGQSHKFLSYLDIPLQHTHDDILLSMNRPPFETARKIIDLARESVPGIVLRTTILVGFPGETAHHFKKLLGDVERVAFDWLGVFSYSQEQGTPSFAYAPQVPEDIKNRRRDLLLNVQQGITARSNQKRVGQVFSVMVDEDANQINDHAKGHTWFQAPEIDGIISLTATAKVGELVSCLVTKVGNAFDLIATQLDEKSN